MAKGKFFVFEGPDGSGQTTQANLLKIYLENKNHQVLLTKEPTLESEAGKKIKEIIDEKYSVEPAELQKLFVADRREHVEKLILPAIAEEKIVISDRYFFSTIAYGSIDCDLNWLIDLNKNFPLPDATFILVVSPEVCLERIEKRGLGKQFFEKAEKLHKVLENYKAMSAKFKEMHLIDGERRIEEIHKEVVEIAEKILV